MQPSRKDAGRSGHSVRGSGVEGEHCIVDGLEELLVEPLDFDFFGLSLTPYSSFTFTFSLLLSLCLTLSLFIRR